MKKTRETSKAKPMTNLIALSLPSNVSLGLHVRMATQQHPHKQELVRRQRDALFTGSGVSGAVEKTPEGLHIGREYNLGRFI